MLNVLLLSLVLTAGECEELHPTGRALDSSPLPPPPAPVPPLPPDPDDQNRLKMPPSMRGLLDGGNAFPGANVQTSEPHPVLIKAAIAHAQDQARRQLQGHHNWERRFHELMRQMDGMIPTEICAESWPEQANDTMKELGYEMFVCWKQSSGHWNCAQKKHRYWGGAMAKGRNGIWYSCIITADAATAAQPASVTPSSRPVRYYQRRFRRR
jgi:hypothetical protein